MKQPQHYRIAILLTCVTSLLVSFTSGNAIATEVYRWTDANGVVHYGDKPPDGQTTQTINVTEPPRSSATEAYPGPGGTQPDAASDAVINDPANGQETDPPQSLADARREKMAEDRKKRRETQAETERLCAKHGTRLEQVEPHRRVFYKNERGESVRMDDDKRIALVEESKDFIAKNCD